MSKQPGPSNQWAILSFISIIVSNSFEIKTFILHNQEHFSASKTLKSERDESIWCNVC